MAHNQQRRSETITLVYNGATPGNSRLLSCIAEVTSIWKIERCSRTDHRYDLDATEYCSPIVWINIEYNWGAATKIVELTSVVRFLHLSEAAKILSWVLPLGSGHWSISTRRRSTSMPLVPLQQRDNIRALRVMIHLSGQEGFALNWLFCRLTCPTKTGLELKTDRKLLQRENIRDYIRIGGFSQKPTQEKLVFACFISPEPSVSPSRLTYNDWKIFNNPGKSYLSICQKKASSRPKGILECGSDSKMGNCVVPWMERKPTTRGKQGIFNGNADRYPDLEQPLKELIKSPIQGVHWRSYHAPSLALLARYGYVHQELISLLRSRGESSAAQVDPTFFALSAHFSRKRKNSEKRCVLMADPLTCRLNN